MAKASGKKNKLRVAIIGCGGIANQKHLPTLAKQSERLDLVAFCDIVEERATKAAAEFGVAGATVYTDYQQLLSAVKPDVVHVCTPNKSHAEITIAALESGAHVLCEKPMAKTADGARAMLMAQQKTGKLLTIGYNNRYRPDSQTLKQIVKAGDLGDIYFAKAHALRRRAVPTWGVFLNEEEQGGGPLIDIGTHALDLTLWLMDNYAPEYVVGTTYHKLGGRKGEANPWGAWDPKAFTVEDSAFGFIKFKNGATVMLESSWALNVRVSGEAICTLCGTEAGADMWDGLRINGTRFGKMYESQMQLGAKGVAFYEGERLKDTDLEARVFYDAIEKGTPLTVLPEQALVVSEILEAIYTSAASGKPVYFDKK
jgi:predicted dehydrogenase